MTDSLPAAVITNFGANLRFRPSTIFVPRREADLLKILGDNRGKRIRAVGRLHSWSGAAVCEEILVDLRHLNFVRVQANDGPPTVDVGAGCQIKRLLAELQRQGGFTLPSLGLITEQSLAGAISTATHGSGRHSLSHYVQSVRLAGYDPVTGEPVMRVIDQGAELQAARCSLGSLGIIAAVRMPIRRQYNVEEHFQR